MSGLGNIRFRREADICDLGDFRKVGLEHHGRRRMEMNTCPHCGIRASAIRLVAATRKWPYRCGGCGKQSRLLPEQNTLVALLVLASVIVCASVIYPNWGIAVALATFLATYAILGVVILFYMRLEKLPLI